MFKISTNKNKKLCCAYRCLNTRSKKDRFCPKHRHRFNKENNPLNYVFYIWKSNCKRRGKTNSVTLEEFKLFCEQTGYLDSKGRKSTSLTIDRIKSSEGYSIENMQVISLSENSSKGATDEGDECPF